MQTNQYVLLILLSGLVTWIPRVLPFIFMHKWTLPKRFERFLEYLPVCILAALLIQSLLTNEKGQLPTFKFEEVLACFPTFIVGYYTRDLLKIVLTGMVTIAMIRWIL